MSYHPRIESSSTASFVTTRSRNSELWFVNNSRLEKAILGYAAKFAARYDVKLYALAIEGNHIHSPAHFPKANRASFMRDFNSCVARAVKRYTPEYKGGKFWGRRYSAEFLPANEDIENQFFYTVLQPVKDGLVDRISDYPGYNCFHDAIYNIPRTFEVIRWAEYNATKRRKKNVAIKDFTDKVTLQFERLPGYEHLSQHEYAQLMIKKLEARRQEILALRKGKGLTQVVGRTALLRTPRGANPHTTKTSTVTSYRPRILSVCPQRRALYLDWYFNLYYAYKEASYKYRCGDLTVKFPPGMYRPYFPALGSA